VLIRASFLCRKWLPLVGVAATPFSHPGKKRRRPDTEKVMPRITRIALSVLLATVATGYLVTRLAAIPPLDPERESLDVLGISTSAIEVFSLVLAVHIQVPRRRLRSLSQALWFQRRSGVSSPEMRSGSVRSCRYPALV
jgi:hypothetical protein